MAHVVFYEKPGCTGNARQRAWLIAAGHHLEVHDLLNTSWTAATLRPFFGALPVVEWFNQRAPAIRDGIVDPTTLDEDAALAALIAAPILIRRPLMAVGDQACCGFDPAHIAAWIGLAATHAAQSRSTAERCAASADAPPCPPAEA
jgi:nitrogenase-associated protein